MEKDRNTKLLDGKGVLKLVTLIKEWVSNNFFAKTGGGSILPVSSGGTGKNTLTSGQLLVGNGTNAVNTVGATNSNTANTVVKRDASGNFSAGTITANLNGTASVATKVGTTNVGSSTTPIYLNGGVPTAVTMTGSTSLRNSLGLGTGGGALSVANGGTGASSLDDVVVGKANAYNTSTAIGSTTNPVYINASGVPTPAGFGACVKAGNTSWSGVESNNSITIPCYQSNTVVQNGIKIGWGSTLPSSGTKGDIFIKI